MRLEVTHIFLIIGAIIVVYMAVYYFDLYKAKREISSLDLDNVIINENVVDLDSLTLRQKIAQMIMVRGDNKDLGFTKLNVGGIFLDRQKTEEDYAALINLYQNSSKISLLVSTDLEGGWTPFKEKKDHQEFPFISEIETSEEAGEIGLNQGKLLKKVGFNMNFAPVAEYRDDIYGGRAFSGTKEEIKGKLAVYIKNLQNNVLGTCKHYPGKAMIRNLHIVSDNQEISRDDLELFDLCLENNISSIMVSHQIVTGEVNSKGKPSTVSSEVISQIDDSVLIIADEINMRGLKKFYPDKTKLYVDLINAGENLILDFNLDSVKLYKLIKELEKEVEKGIIDKNKIDESVTKVLEKKGYEVG